MNKDFGKRILVKGFWFMLVFVCLFALLSACSQPQTPAADGAEDAVLELVSRSVLVVTGTVDEPVIEIIEGDQPDAETVEFITEEVASGEWPLNEEFELIVEENPGDISAETDRRGCSEGPQNPLDNEGYTHSHSWSTVSSSTTTHLHGFKFCEKTRTVQKCSYCLDTRTSTRHSR